MDFPYDLMDVGDRATHVAKAEQILYSQTGS